MCDCKKCGQCSHCYLGHDEFDDELGEQQVMEEY